MDVLRQEFNRLEDRYYDLDALINRATGMLLVHGDMGGAFNLIEQINAARFQVEDALTDLESSLDGFDVDQGF
jgi:hypothetical protein